MNTFAGRNGGNDLTHEYPFPKPDSPFAALENTCFAVKVVLVSSFEEIRAALPYFYFLIPKDERNEKTFTPFCSGALPRH